MSSTSARDNRSCRYPSLFLLHLIIYHFTLLHPWSCHSCSFLLSASPLSFHVTNEAIFRAPSWKSFIKDVLLNLHSGRRPVAEPATCKFNEHVNSIQWRDAYNSSWREGFPRLPLSLSPPSLLHLSLNRALPSWLIATVPCSPCLKGLYPFVVLDTWCSTKLAPLYLPEEAQAECFSYFLSNISLIFILHFSILSFF